MVCRLSASFSKFSIDKISKCAIVPHMNATILPVIAKSQEGNAASNLSNLSELYDSFDAPKDKSATVTCNALDRLLAEIVKASKDEADIIGNLRYIENQVRNARNAVEVETAALAR